ncbi:MAG: nucleotidyl transferase AbiEii/AbiGii toxin family protein [Lachnospiraceae bacterium]|nr:nucleotidyl transferase AbiEii/AbiGii toxin family protein [Lachnospiraceae bacterium]
MNLSVMIKEIQGLGYEPDDARARVCQDIVLKAIAHSTLSRNVTIKGGILMRNMTQNIRRATQDMDIDFIRYSLSDESIDYFIDKLNCLEGVVIKRVGKIEELSQQDYNGKRVYIQISDYKGNFIDSKIDLGVHKHLEIEQEEYCFDIAFDDEGASLLANTREQMFTEKLRSLLKFGSFSTRYKDIYDMYYHCGKMNEDKLFQCLQIFIFDDSGMRENDMDAVVKRLEFVFSDKAYAQRVNTSDKRWLDDDIIDIFTCILEYLKKQRSTPT